MLSDEELRALADDIRVNGLAHPLVIWDAGGEWLLLDGRNRRRACELAGIHPATTVWSGRDPVAFVVSANLHRRHLTSSQRAQIADELARLPKGVNKGSDVQICTSLTQDEAAALLRVSKRSVQNARAVKERGVPELADAVRKGDVAVSAAAEVAKLPEEEQREVVAKGKKAVADRAREARAKPPTPEPAARWDAEDFLLEVRQQIQDWQTEWMRHETRVARLARALRMKADLFEKEETEKCAK
jgi:hypothetical protein